MIPTIETLELLKALPLAEEGEVFYVASEQRPYKLVEGEWTPVEDLSESVSIGTLYDVNKQIISQIKTMTPEEINAGLDLIGDFVEDTNAKYYMLLNHDFHYYTLFVREQNGWPLQEALRACIDSFDKEYKGIDYSAEGDAIEIWIEIKLYGPIMFLLFPYDKGVVLCE